MHRNNILHLGNNETGIPSNQKDQMLETEGKSKDNEEINKYGHQTQVRPKPKPRKHINPSPQVQVQITNADDEVGDDMVATRKLHSSIWLIVLQKQVVFQMVH